jgi:hypothetical protein
LLFLRTGAIHVTTATRGKEKQMSTIDSTNGGTPETAAAPAKGKSKSGKKGKPAKDAGRAKKTARKPKSDGTNKKAEVTAMMKHAKGAKLAEIVKATGLAAAHGAGVRQHPRQQRRGNDRVVQERRG